MSSRTIFSFLAIASIAASPLSAQLLGGGGGLGGTLGGPGSTLGQVGGAVDRTLGTVPGNQPRPGSSSAPFAPVSLDSVGGVAQSVAGSASTLASMRAARLNNLVQSNAQTLDRDHNRAPVRRGVLIATDPSPADLTMAASKGFRVIRDEQVAELGIRMVTLAIPAKDDVRDAMKHLSKAAPTLSLDYDHIYEPAGGSLAPALGTTLAAAPFRPGTRIAMIDGGVASHASLSRASIEQRGFAGAAQPTGHGTAVASLLVGSQGAFRGAARGANLFVGDVYGGSPAAGSASVIVRALAWAAAKKPEVINVSLVGPRNALLERAVQVLRARGITIVAAVGNDGPAAPPQYPASYPGVIAVTGVDSGNRALREAGKAAHLDFAAPGADLAAALPSGGYVSVRGTSFAAPLAAARFAATGNWQRLVAEAVPGKGKVGHGILCSTCAIAPKTVGAK